jgi:hypothetical protein
MAKSRKRWVFTPPKPAKPSIPHQLKATVETRAQALVEHLKAQHIQPTPAEPDVNYLIDIRTKWYRGYFYFCGTYACPGPNALSPTFETCFARMEYIGDDRFNLAYKRYTEQWWELYANLTFEECFSAVRDEPHFMP